MAYVATYSHITVASIPKEVWDEAWFSAVSWKGFLQAVPGFHGLRYSARYLPNGDIRFHTVTVWEFPEQLEEWVDSPYSFEVFFKALEKPAYDIFRESYEDLV